MGDKFHRYSAFIGLGSGGQSPCPSIPSRDEEMIGPLYDPVAGFLYRPHRALIAVCDHYLLSYFPVLNSHLIHSCLPNTEFGC